MQENLERVMYVLNDHLYFDRLWDLLFELNFEKTGHNHEPPLT